MKEYKGFTLEQMCHRTGSLKILSNPSRMNNTLFYPNGEKKFEPHKKLAKDVKIA